MGFVDLFSSASMPVLKVLLVTALGLFLALESVDLLGHGTRQQVNNLVFFVFNPALVGSNIAKTIMLESMISMWFMPVNILLTFIIGSALRWVLMIIAKPPKHLKGLILGTCSAGNLGNLLLIIIPAVCKEKGSPFGDPDVCYELGIAYASLSLAIGAVFLWLYVYNLVRVFSCYSPDSSSNVASINETRTMLEDLTRSLLPLSTLSSTHFKGKLKVMTNVMQQHLGNFSRRINLKVVFAPSTIGAIVGFMIGIVSPARKLLIGTKVVKIAILLVGSYDLTILQVKNDPSLHRIAAENLTISIRSYDSDLADTKTILGRISILTTLIGTTTPLRMILDSASLVGDAANPILTLIVGGNLLRGLRGSGISLHLVFGIIVVRYVFMPLFGILVVKGAIYLRIVQANPLYVFILLLQFAVPPAMNIGTITQLFGAGESEWSVIMLWSYGLASFSLTLWSTFFMWLVA